MSANSSKNETKATISFQTGNGVWQNLGTGIVSLGWGNTTNQPKNPYWPTKVIENNRTVIVYFENGHKRVVTCSEEDEFNKEFGFLLALAHEVFGSKDKYRQMYTKKVDKKAYPKFKNKKGNPVFDGAKGVSVDEAVEIIKRVSKNFNQKDS